MTIDELVAKEQSLVSELDNVRAEIHEARCESAGIRVGELVTYKNKEFRVASIKFSYYELKPWVRGNQKLKNGTFSNVARLLFADWNKL